MNKKTRLVLVFILVLIIVLACDKKRVYDNVISLPSKGWETTNLIKFDIPVTDITKAYDIFIHFRNNGSYQYSNIWLFIETVSPNDNSLRDTFEIRLADDSGRWLGKGIGDINEMLVPYKQNILFPNRGVYLVTIQQAMREQTLEHVFDIGIRLQYHY
jgi:gliding motility-associated lipoprotein GldH